MGSPASALDPETLPTQYLFANWQDDLPQNTVQAIAQTADGYLWIGTQGGLSRFDGIRFTEMTPQAPNEVAAMDVRDLLRDSQGRLWVGTRGDGLFVVENGRLRGERALDAIPSRVVFSLAEGAGGNLWIGTRNSGVVRLKEDRAESFSLSLGLPSERVFSVLEDRQGTLWAGASEGGLSRFDGTRFAAVGEATLKGVTVLSLLEDSTDHLWVGTRRSGLFRLDPSRELAPEPILGPTGQPFSEGIMDLGEDRQGNVWAATYGGGLLRIRDGRTRAVTAASGLSAEAVMAVFEDREGNLWAGTEGGGLNQLRDGTFRTFGQPEGLGSEQVWTVLEDRRGALWVGTEGSGLARLEEDHVSLFGTSQGLSSDSVTAILEDSRGDLWVGSRGQGLNRIRDGKVRIYDQSDGLSNNTILAMAEGPDGVLWLGTPGSGLNRFADPHFESLTQYPELVDNLILALALGSQGELLIGTDSGLKILRETGVEVYSTDQGLPNNTVFSLLAEEDGSVWLGTYGGGLSLLRDGQFANFDRRHGLASDVVLQILDDDQGNLWLGSNQGISRLAKEDLKALARGERQTVDAVSYGKADGMRAAECNGGYQPAAFKDSRGRLWFSTIRGVVTVDPARLRTNEVPPGVVIEAITVDGQDLLSVGDGGHEEATEARLPAGRQRFEITYSGLSFSDPEAVRFRYRLEGYDRDWIDVGSERRATYTNLPTGQSYRFQVSAANEAGVWNEQGAAYSFYIEPFFYQQPWFLALLAAVLFLTAWLAYRLRVRHLVRRTAHLEAVVSDRTREVVEQRDQLREANVQLTSLNNFKSEFLGIAAHDLKNPLSVIYAYAGVIAEKAGDNPRLVRIARRISTSTNQMLNIVSDLLDTTAMESGKLRFEPEPVNVSATITDILERYQLAAAERGVELRLTAEEDVQACVDLEKVTRIVENLLSNAIRYTEDSSTVEVRLEQLGEAPEQRIRLAVIDEGPGLSEDQISRIFDRFERLAAKHGVEERSVGLGLSIVKQFVEIHQGTVWVDSTPGRGSTFYVELPREASPQGVGS
ncbi:MAG: hypothetical protein K0U98_25640 [Deltaproteobacteria bacterium]|nr:hypothetical protein [Deltaproteobacteria bacterium]